MLYRPTAQAVPERALRAWPLILESKPSIVFSDRLLEWTWSPDDLQGLELGLKCELCRLTNGLQRFYLLWKPQTKVQQTVLSSFRTLGAISSWCLETRTCLIRHHDDIFLLCFVARSCSVRLTLFLIWLCTGYEWLYTFHISSKEAQENGRRKLANCSLLHECKVEWHQTSRPFQPDTVLETRVGEL